MPINLFSPEILTDTKLTLKLFKPSFALMPLHPVSGVSTEGGGADWEPNLGGVKYSGSSTKT